MLKIIVSDSIAQVGIDKLREYAGVDVLTKITGPELVEKIGEYDALVVRSRTKVTKEVIEAGGNLKVIGRAGVGIDNIDLEAVTRRGIIVLNAPEGNIISTAEHTIAMLVALSRNIPQATASLKMGKWDRKKYLGVEIYNKTLGLIGLGRVGSQVATRARGLNMKVIAYDPFVSPDQAAKLGVELTSLDNLLSNSDYISIHTPLTDSTKGMLGEREFELMKDGIRVLNCARGGVVDERSLYKALKSGKVAGAALDVYESEPPTDSPLLELDSVICTPHLAASTAEAQVNVAIDVADQVIAALKGETVRNAINIPTLPKEILEEVKPYIKLAEQMGKLQGQLADGPIESVEVIYNGKLSNFDMKIVTNSFLKGLLEMITEGMVNFVNSPMIAESRGITVRESRSATAIDYTSLIISMVHSAKRKLEVAGTLFGKTDPRIVIIDGYRVDVVPLGHLLIVWHTDRPGFVGRMGTILGSANINIAGMQLGRERPRGKAVVVLSVDDSVPPELIDEIMNIEGIALGKSVEL